MLTFPKPSGSQWIINHPEYANPAYPLPVIDGLLTLAYITYPQIARLSVENQAVAFNLAVCHQRQLFDRSNCGIDGILLQVKSRNDSRTFAVSEHEDKELSSTSCGRSLYLLLQTVMAGVHINRSNNSCGGCGC